MTTQFRCFGCGQPVSSPLPDDAVLRAIAWCDWCIDEGKDQDRTTAKFTALDVGCLRENAALFAESTANNYFLNSLANRIEAMLSPE